MSLTIALPVFGTKSNTHKLFGTATWYKIKYAQILWHSNLTSDRMLRHVSQQIHGRIGLAGGGRPAKGLAGGGRPAKGPRSLSALGQRRRVCALAPDFVVGF